jgi:hypothetical protein
MIQYPEPRSMADVLNDILSRLEALEKKASKK